MSTDTWVSAVSGDWSDVADWSSGVPNNSATAAAISASGAYTVTIGADEQFSVASLSFIGSDATLRIDGGLTSSGTVTITPGSGIYLDGTLSGGTIADSSGGVSCVGGTLSGVSYQGTLNMSSDNSTLTITGPTNFAGAGGSGAGTINLAEPSSGYGVASLLNIAGTDTLNNVTIDIGNGRFDAPVTTLENLDTTGAGAVLTLGPSCAIVQEGGYAALSSSGFAGDMIVNYGKINAAYAGGHLYIDADFFTNNGTMSVSNGAFIDLSGDISAGLVNSIHKSGGVVAIDGTVTGGTITAPSGGVDGFGGTLSGVSFQGTLNMSLDNSTLTIAGGTTFAGAGGKGKGTINLSEPSSGYGVASLLNIAGTETLNNLTIDIGNGRFDAAVTAINNLDTSGQGAVLTLGSSCTITQTGGYAALSSSGLSGDMIVNDGKLVSSYSGGHFYIDADFFTNNGSISVSNGAFIDLSGDISAALVNSIHKSNGIVAIDGTVAGGMISATTGGVGGFGGTLSGVSYRGTLDLSSDNSTLTLTNGTKFAGAAGKGVGTIDLSDPSSGYGVSNVLRVLGNQTLDNVVIDIGNSGFAAAPQSIVNLDAGTGAVLTLGSKTTIDQTGAHAALTSSNLFGDRIINDGVITANYESGAFSIDVAKFSNAGLITVSNGETLTSQSGEAGIAQALANTGTINADGGSIDLTGAVSGAGGVIDIQDGGTVQLQSNAASSQAIEFGAGTNSLIVDALATMKSVIMGFAAGDTIDLAGVNATSESYAAGTLTLLHGKSVLGKIDLPGSFVTSSFTLSSDGNGGTDIQLAPSASRPLSVLHATLTAGDFGLEAVQFRNVSASAIAAGAFQRTALTDHGLWPDIMHSLALRSL